MPCNPFNGIFEAFNFMFKVFIICRWHSGQNHFIFFENLLEFFTRIDSDVRLCWSECMCNIRMRLSDNRTNNNKSVICFCPLADVRRTLVCPLRSMPHSIKVSFLVALIKAYECSKTFNRHYANRLRKTGCVLMLVRAHKSMFTAYQTLWKDARAETFMKIDWLVIKSVRRQMEEKGRKLDASIDSCMVACSDRRKEANKNIRLQKSVVVMRAEQNIHRVIYFENDDRVCHAHIHG